MGDLSGRVRAGLVLRELSQKRTGRGMSVHIDVLPDEQHHRRRHRILMPMRSPVVVALGLALAACPLTACSDGEDPPHTLG